MTPIDFHPAAEQEVEEAAQHLEGRRPGLGRDFRTELAAALARIGSNPALYAEDIDDFRACPLHRFSYTLFYLILDDHVWVAALAHQSRRPGYWLGRQPD